MAVRRAFITGITGQDGAYLAQHLLGLGYEVAGACRALTEQKCWRLDELGVRERIRLYAMDLASQSSIHEVLEKCQPTEIYNLAAQSSVGVSFEQPVYTGDIDGLGVARLLEAIRAVVPDARFYQASTSELFGKEQVPPQSENTPFHPCSPYAVAKLYAHWMSVHYRESGKLYACAGILFNHESPLRGEEFVTRKITRGLAKLACGGDQPVRLGNLDSQRDWGFAGDFVRGMRMMLQQDSPRDFVLSTGLVHSVRDFAQTAASVAGFELVWERLSVGEEIGVDRKTGRRLIETAVSEFRPSEMHLLRGDSSRAREHLGWQPEVSFPALVQMMVETDLKRERRLNNPASALT